MSLACTTIMAGRGRMAMKLRNKKTGDIWEFDCGFSMHASQETAERAGARSGSLTCFADSIAELNEEWEDYKPTEKKPRRYRLIKDLPTFDEGDEFYIAQTGALWYDGGGDDDVCAYATSTLMKFPNILEEWFEPIEPKEPLIKDEKIRKVVRLCADIWGANKILATKSGSRIEFSDGTSYMRYVGFMYAEWQDEIEDRTYYTLTELCGEEETPEPVEPKFIDLGERIKEKGEE